MQLNEYQEKAGATAKYPGAGNEFVYPALGLVGEAGEVADKFKKLIRDHGIAHPSDIPEEAKEELAKELGDVLWYVSRLSSELGYELEDVAQRNIDKLYSRKERGTLSGSGDNR